MTSDANQLFNDILRRYERPLVRYAQNLVGQLDDARDIVQDVFLKLSQGFDSIDHERVAPWLFTVCKNRATDHLRKHHRMTLMEHEELDREASEEDQPGDAMQREETSAALLQLLTTLPDKQREAIRLKFIGELSYKEISDIMHTSVGNVGYLIHHGVLALREQWLSLDGSGRRVACAA
jgi:RNA polymerase sigma factor (sigma-70 family)